jgi:glycosyltransferase involved in cell wall biosynthesis
LIYQGLLGPDRCLLELIAAFRSIPDPTIGLVLLGRGTEQDYLTALFALAKADDRVVYLGQIPPPEHLRITSGCSWGAMLYRPTSLNNIYCAPNKLYEFAECGLGMLMPAFPGMRHVNDRFGVGQLCDPTSIPSIADALQRLFTTRTDSYRTAANCFLTVQPRSDELYREVLEFLAAASRHRV